MKTYWYQIGCLWSVCVSSPCFLFLSSFSWRSTAPDWVRLRTLGSSACTELKEWPQCHFEIHFPHRELFSTFLSHSDTWRSWKGKQWKREWRYPMKYRSRPKWWVWQSRSWSFPQEVRWWCPCTATQWCHGECRLSRSTLRSQEAVLSPFV